MDTFILDDGTSTIRCPAFMAFRILVNISEMGSVIALMCSYPERLIFYHDDFTTPGIFPWLASFLKQILHISNLLR